MMTGPSLTRQYAGADVRRLRCIPFPEPRAPDEDGTLTAHKLMALGAYDTDMHILSLLDLQLTSSETTSSTSLTTLASWEHPGGEVTDLHVSRQPSGSVLLLAGSSSGSITRLHMLVPQAPGSVPRDIQLLGGDVQGQQLQPWAQPHRGAVAFVDHNPDDNLVLSGGRDGSLWIGDADGAGDGQPWCVACSVHTGAVVVCGAQCVCVCVCVEKGKRVGIFASPGGCKHQQAYAVAIHRTV